jgi:hypothetical protein
VARAVPAAFVTQSRAGEGEQASSGRCDVAACSAITVNELSSAQRRKRSPTTCGDVHPGRSEAYSHSAMEPLHRAREAEEVSVMNVRSVPHQVTRLVFDVGQPYEKFRSRYEAAVPPADPQRRGEQGPHRADAGGGFASGARAAVGERVQCGPRVLSIDRPIGHATARQPLRPELRCRWGPWSVSLNHLRFDRCRSIRGT